MVNKALLYRKSESKLRVLKIHAFRAIDNPILCEEYAQGHHNLLKQYGVTSITSNNRKWEKHKNTFVIVARDLATSEIVGGIRIQKYDDDFVLPVQKAISNQAPEIDERVEFDSLNGGTGEMCGLWNSKSVAQMKVSWMLTRVSVAICSQIGVNSLWGICADYTLPMFEDVGFRIAKDVGDNGSFSYPTPEYISHPVRMSTIDLGKMGEAARQEVQLLRENPQASLRLSGDWYRIELKFNLNLKHG